MIVDNQNAGAEDLDISLHMLSIVKEEQMGVMPRRHGEATSSDVLSAAEEETIQVGIQRVEASTIN
jgi:hypothetical protein